MGFDVCICVACCIAAGTGMSSLFRSKTRTTQGILHVHRRFDYFATEHVFIGLLDP